MSNREDISIKLDINRNGKGKIAIKEKMKDTMAK